MKELFQEYPTPWTEGEYGHVVAANGQQVPYIPADQVFALVNATAGLNVEKLAQLRAGLDELCVRMKDIDTNNISQMNHAIAMSSVVCMYYREVVGEK